MLQIFPLMQVYRAKERLDMELLQQQQTADSSSGSSQSSKSEDPPKS